jgi:acyl carrier protein
VDTAAHTLPSDSDEALSALTGVVRELVRQTHPHASRTVTPESRLDADLGLDSLARIELLHRIEDRFGLRLAEQTLLAIETPRELLGALRSAAGLPATATTWRVEAQPVAAAQTLAGQPDDADTLTAMLDWYVNAAPQRRHVLFYKSADEIEEIDYAGLARGARAIALGLIDRGIERQQTVAIMLPTSLEFLYTFFGVLAAGAIPVPIYPPARMSQLEDHLRRQSAILDSAQAAALITIPEARLLAQFLMSQVSSLREVVTVADLRRSHHAASLPTLRSDDIAFIQYTSGSTGNPKGVILTHANLLANIRAWGKACDFKPEDVAVSWLPLYHDMGLIGAWLGSLYHGGSLVLMSPLDFLARPERWLQAIHRHRGTMTAAPNFAF